MMKRRIENSLFSTHRFKKTFLQNTSGPGRRSAVCNFKLKIKLKFNNMWKYDTWYYAT